MRYFGSLWLFISLITLAFLAILCIPSACAEDTVVLVVDSVPRVATIKVNDYVIPPQIQPYSLKFSRGAEVMISVDSVSYVQDEGVRYVFHSWEDGSTSNPRTLKLVGNMTYIMAVMKKQYRVTVISDIGFVNGSGWYDAGSLVKIKSEPVIRVGKGERYVFHSWSYGYRPFSPENEFVVQRPITVEAKYVHEYYVNVSSNGGFNVCCPGWYKEGDMVTVWAERCVEEDGVRICFKRWISNTPILSTHFREGDNVAEILVNRPIQLVAEYEKECRVIIYDPYSKPKEEWVPCGSRFPVSVKPVVSLGEEVRAVFNGFVVNGVKRLRDPSALIVVDGPTVVEAVYKREYLVRVTTPYGVKSYWVGENETLVLTPPKESVTYILANLNFKGWRGIGYEAGGRAVIRVDSPKHISAEYALEPDYTNILIVCAMITVIFTVDRLTRKRTP